MGVGARAITYFNEREMVRGEEKAFKGEREEC